MAVYDNSVVRRQDRQLDEQAAKELLTGGEYGFLALGGCEGGYGTPLNFVFDGSSIYFHCAPQGERLRRLEQCDRVCFCVVGATEPLPDRFTTLYASVMVFGRLVEVADESERMSALGLIVDKYSPGFREMGMKYAAASAPRTVVLRLEVERISGKCKA